MSEETGPWWWDDFETENCQFCKDQDVCVLEPEEVEDQCLGVRTSSEGENK